MSKLTGLETFIRSKVKLPKLRKDPLLLTARINRFRAGVFNLYETISKWLLPLDKENIVYLSRSETTLRESPASPYSVEKLTIVIGDEVVRFVPKGALATAFSQGRVDAIGSRSVFSLLLKNGKWYIFNALPESNLVPFNKQSFTDLLDAIIK